MLKGPLINPLIPERKSLSKRFLIILILAALLSTVLPACSPAHVRKEKQIQAWMIDSTDGSLYRHVGTNEEDAMLILGNPDAEKFMCFDRASLKEVIMRATE